MPGTISTFLFSSFNILIFRLSKIEGQLKNGAPAAPAAAAADNDDDDDVDLFASDDEVDEEAEKIKANRCMNYSC